MSLVTAQLVAHTIKPVSGFPLRALEGKGVLLDAADLAQKNKVFLTFYEGLVRHDLSIPKRIVELASKEYERRSLYDAALAEIRQESQVQGIEFMVFKVKPFVYVGDDIDFFLPNPKSFSLFIELLKELGYDLLGSGPPETTLGKRVEGVDIVADVHRSLSASYVPYIDGSRVWERRVVGDLHGLQVSMPSLDDEMMILVAHSLQKELRMNLAEFFTARYIISRITPMNLYEHARSEHMASTLWIFLLAGNRLSEILFDRPLLSGCLPAEPILLRFADRILTRDIGQDPALPYRFHPSLPMIAYLEKLKGEVIHGGREALDFIASLLKAPFTNREGLGIVLSYIRFRS